MQLQSYKKVKSKLNIRLVHLKLHTRRRNDQLKPIGRAFRSFALNSTSLNYKRETTAIRNFHKFATSGVKLKTKVIVPPARKHRFIIIPVTHIATSAHVVPGRVSVSRNKGLRKRIYSGMFHNPVHSTVELPAFIIAALSRVVFSTAVIFRQGKPDGSSPQQSANFPRDCLDRTRRARLSLYSLYSTGYKQVAPRIRA